MGLALVDWHHSGWKHKKDMHSKKLLPIDVLTCKRPKVGNLSLRPISFKKNKVTPWSLQWHMRPAAGWSRPSRSSARYERPRNVRTKSSQDSEHCNSLASKLTNVPRRSSSRGADGIYTICCSARDDGWRPSLGRGESCGVPYAAGCVPNRVLLEWWCEWIIGMERLAVGAEVASCQVR
jgi:hypothetical protein